jgi:hypothetical protein
MVDPFVPHVLGRLALSQQLAHQDRRLGTYLHTPYQGGFCFFRLTRYAYLVTGSEPLGRHVSGQVTWVYAHDQVGYQKSLPGRRILHGRITTA